MYVPFPRNASRARSAPPDWCWAPRTRAPTDRARRHPGAVRAGRGELQEGHDGPGSQRLPARGRRRPRGSQSSALAGGLDVPASAEHAGPLQSPAAGVPPGLHYADDLAHPGAWRRAGRRRIARDRDPGAGRARRRPPPRRAWPRPPARRCASKAAPAGGRGRPDGQGARPRAPIGAQPPPQSGKMAAVALTHAYPCPTSSP